jgi:hypothetical protein
MHAAHGQHQFLLGSDLDFLVRRRLTQICIFKSAIHHGKNEKSRSDPYRAVVVVGGAGRDGTARSFQFNNALNTMLNSP